MQASSLNIFFVVDEETNEAIKKEMKREEFRNALFCLLLLVFIHNTAMNMRCWEKERANDYE